MTDSEDRNPVEILADEFVERFRAGEFPSLSEYTRRHPELAEEIQELFPLLVEMEQARSLESAALRPDKLQFSISENQQLGDYKIIREIGRGGMGIVFEAEQISLGRQVALKVLPNSGLDKRFAERFQREARAAGMLHHSNIVPVYDVGEQNGILFYAMQLIPGASLEAVIRELRRLRAGEEPSTGGETLAGESMSTLLSGSFSDASGSHGNSRSGSTKREFCKQVARLGIRVAEALDYAHGQGVLHRDIKPANLLLDSSGTIWITDFGLARTNDSSNLTQSGDIVGTLRYMAPESFQQETDQRSEVYALAITLYEMLALRPAFDERNRNRLIQSVSNSSPPALRNLEPGVPFDLETILSRAFDREPSSRYQTAAEFAADLQRFVNDEPIHARRLSAIERFTRWRQRNARLAMSLMTVAGLISILAIVSTIAAARLSGLNRRLTDTIGDLTDARNDANEARRNAESTSVENLSLAQEAETARQESVTTLAKMYADRGFLAGDDSLPAVASLWFSHAAQLTPHDTELQEANRLLAKSWWDHAPQPVAMIPVKTTSSSAYFQPVDPDSPERKVSLLTVLEGDQLRVWNFRTGQQLAWARSGICKARWAPDGKQLAIAFTARGGEIVEATTGTVAGRFQTEEHASALTWSPDGSRLAVGTHNVSMWTTSGELVRTGFREHPERVYGLTFSPDGDYLATSCRDKLVRLFRLETDQQQLADPVFSPLRHATHGKVAAVFCNGGKSLVTVDGSKMRWTNVESGKNVTPELHSQKLGYVLDLSSSPDGRWVAAAGDMSAMFWNTNGKTTELRHTNNVTRLAFSPDSSRLMTVGLDGNVRFWPLNRADTSDIRPDFRLPKRDWPHVDYSDDGQHVVLTNKSYATIWRLPSRHSFVRRIANVSSPKIRPRISSDGQLATFGRVRALNQPQILTKRLSVIRTVDGAPAGPTLALSGRLVDSCVCADNKTVAVASVANDSGHLQFFDITSGRVIGEPLQLPAKPNTLDARPNSSQVAILCRDGSLVVADAADGIEVFTVKHLTWQQPPGLPGVSYSPDGKALITVDSAQRVYVRDAENGEERFSAISPVVNKTGLCWSIDVSPNGRFLATAVTGENFVFVWDMQTGDRIGQPMSQAGPYYGINVVQFSPDGGQILTGHSNGELRLWNWKTGELANVPMQNPNAVTDAAFSADGKYIIAAIRLGTIRIWNTVTGRLAVPAAIFPPNDLGTNAVAVHDSTVIASAARGYYLLDLDQLLQPPQGSDSIRQLAAEVASRRQLQRGAVSPLSTKELHARWREYVETRGPSDAFTGVAKVGNELANLPGGPTEFGRQVDSELARLSRKVEAAPGNISAILGRARFLGRIGRWRHAAEDALLAGDSVPAKATNVLYREPWARAAEFLILAGDVEGYDKVCQQMVANFRDTKVDLIADSVCKAVLLKPGAVIRDELPIELVMRRADESGPVAHQNWFRACCVLINYRRGESAESLNWAEKIKSRDKQVQALALTVKAMAEYQLDRQGQAAQTLKTAEGLIPEAIRGLGTDGFQGTFPIEKAVAGPDWYVAEILRQEAAKLIRGQ